MAHYNAVCGQCHAALPARHATGSDCISCHMPKRRTQDVIHAVMTDHYIQRRAPADALEPRRERQDSDDYQYRGPVVSYFPAPAIYEAVAQVTHQSNLKAGLPRLAAEIAKQPSAQAEFYNELGEAYRNAGLPRSAVTAFEQALKKSPDSSVALLDLAEALSETGQDARAALLLKNSKSDDPLLWFQAGDYDKALALDPDLAPAHNGRGEKLAETGNLAEAEAEFRAALRSEPDLPSANSNLGHALAARREPGEAAWYFEKAVRRDPKDADTRVNYGATLLALNRPDEALRQFEQALKIRPAFGLAHLQAAAVLSATGDAAAARAHLLLAARDPDPEIRRRANEKLR
jgi:tetratricopeptide (TPR) repeat protein